MTDAHDADEDEGRPQADDADEGGESAGANGETGASADVDDPETDDGTDAGPDRGAADDPDPAPAEEGESGDGGDRDDGSGAGGEIGADDSGAVGGSRDAADAADLAADRPAGPDDRCDFCRLPCPEPVVTAEYEGFTYAFCSAACRDAMADSERVFTEYRGYRRFRPGVEGLDRRLPQGMLRNSFVLLTGQAGTRDGAVRTELAWRALQRGEPAVVVSLQEPPVSVVERFLTLEWNVLPYLESGQLHVLDAFTYRLDHPDRLYDRMNDWNRHLQSVVADASTVVEDAADLRELRSKLEGCLDRMGMVDAGVVTIDSLTELGSLVQPVRAYDFVKDVRAGVCKGRFVPVFAGATYAGDADRFPHDLDYTADGVVDMQLNDGIVEDTLIKRVRIRKMSGVLAIAEWTAYEYTGGAGMVTFDPEAEMAKARAAAGDEDEDEDEDEDGDGSDDGTDDSDGETDGDDGDGDDDGQGGGTEQRDGGDDDRTGATGRPGDAGSQSDADDPASTSG